MISLMSPPSHNKIKTEKNTCFSTSYQNDEQHKHRVGITQHLNLLQLELIIESFTSDRRTTLISLEKYIKSPNKRICQVLRI